MGARARQSIGMDGTGSFEFVGCYEEGVQYMQRRTLQHLSFAMNMKRIIRALMQS